MGSKTTTRMFIFDQAQHALTQNVRRKKLQNHDENKTISNFLLQSHLAIKGTVQRDGSGRK
jgi:hypothetical protein